jgi:hypothetical protein
MSRIGLTEGRMPMLEGINVPLNEGHDTQLQTIRDLMLAAARRGAWLTLGEIAEMTEIGEASVSAQLRHLRKPRYGLHLVEKRQRTEYSVVPGSEGHVRSSEKRRIVPGPVMWEYRVLPSAGCRMIADSLEGVGDVACCGQQQSEEVSDAEARD